MSRVAPLRRAFIVAALLMAASATGLARADGAERGFHLRHGATSRAARALALRWTVMRLPTAGAGPFSSAEPGIAAGPAGILLADAASANSGAPPTFWLSHDAGRTWSSGRDYDASGASTGDADGAIGQDGYLYALNLGYQTSPPAQPTNPTVLVYRSANGRVWAGPASFPVPHGLDQPDRPWLAVNPRHPANVDVVNSEGAGNFVIWRSFDHGAHFAGPTAVSGGPNGQAALALSSRPLFDPSHDGRMFMLYETTAPVGAATLLAGGAPVYEFPMTQLWLATSTDAGARWSNRLVLDTGALEGPLRDATLGHLLVSSAVDGAGRLYAAFSLRLAGTTPTSIYLIHSADHGASWSAPAKLAVPTSSNVMPALAVTADGRRAYVSWYGSDDPDFRDAGARWVEMAAQVSNPFAASALSTASQVSGSSPVHVGGIDTAGALASDLGADWGLRDFQSLTVDGCGRPHLAWALDAGASATETAVGSASRVPARRRRGCRLMGRHPRMNGMTP